VFLLDTNVISELRVGKANPSAAVRRWAASIPGNQLYFSSVSILELETGVLLVERKDAQQGQMLRSWLQGVMKEFSSQVLPFGSTTAVLCAAMHVPDRRPDRDAMIAATAKEHGYTIATRNTADFDDCGVQLLNPWLAL
jgi:predicted nucleic acid-binding protein